MRRKKEFLSTEVTCVTVEVAAEVEICVPLVATLQINLASDAVKLDTCHVIAPMNLRRNATNANKSVILQEIALMRVFKVSRDP